VFTKQEECSINVIRDPMLQSPCVQKIKIKKKRKVDITNVVQGPMLQSTMGLNNNNMYITRVMQDPMIQSP
jgi:hypothetical protein